MSADLKSLQLFMQRCARLGVRSVNVPGVIAFDLWSPPALLTATGHIEKLVDEAAASHAPNINAVYVEPAPKGPQHPFDAYVEQQHGVTTDTLFHSVS